MSHGSLLPSKTVTSVSKHLILVSAARACFLFFCITRLFFCITRLLKTTAHAPSLLLFPNGCVASWDMTQWCVWHDAFMCVTRRVWRTIQRRAFVSKWMCARTHANVCQDSFVRVPWRICVSNTTYSYVWHEGSVGEFKGVLLIQNGCVPCLVHTSAMTTCVWHDSFICVTRRVWRTIQRRASVSKWSTQTTMAL